MSLVRPRPQETGAAPPVCTSLACREELSEREHTMLHALERDIATARNATRPLLPIFKPGRGQFHFVILPYGHPLREEFKRSRIYVSALTLGSDEFYSVKSLGRVLEKLKSRYGIRINGLQLEPKTRDYFTYHIDLEAA